MKALKYLFAFLLVGFIYLSCEDSLAWNSPETEIVDLEVKQVPFKGTFQSTPGGYEMIECFDPSNGYSIMGPVFNLMTGNATHLGILDRESSPLIIADCELDLEEGVLIGTLDMTFKNKNGDGIRILGQSIMGLYGQPSSGEYEVIEGYGKFEGALGHMTSKGVVDFDVAVADFTVEGVVSQPNAIK